MRNPETQPIQYRTRVYGKYEVTCSNSGDGWRYYSGKVLGARKFDSDDEREVKKWARVMIAELQHEERTLEEERPEKKAVDSSSPEHDQLELFE